MKPSEYYRNEIVDLDSPIFFHMTKVYMHIIELEKVDEKLAWMVAKGRDL